MTTLVRETMLSNELSVQVFYLPTSDGVNIKAVYHDGRKLSGILNDAERQLLRDELIEEAV